ncbi:MAG: hypothetical protein IH623_03890 [Verrucomicrobia bacterium]|nr:hypothetical protein [Verrucomicrobiota bacterium]
MRVRRHDRPVAARTLCQSQSRRDWTAPANPTNFVASARTRYDSFGNPVSLFDPLSDGTGNTAQGHFRDPSSGPAFHTCPVSETIHIGDGLTAVSTAVF